MFLTNPLKNILKPPLTQLPSLPLPPPTIFCPTLIKAQNSYLKKYSENHNFEEKKSWEQFETILFKLIR